MKKVSGPQVVTASGPQVVTASGPQVVTASGPQVVTASEAAEMPLPAEIQEALGER